jgi:hypothetical protein
MVEPFINFPMESLTSLGNGIKINGKSYDLYPVAERTDRLLCDIIGLSYDSFVSLPVSEQLGIYEQNAPTVLSHVLSALVSSYDPEFVNFLSSHTNFTFTSDHLLNCTCFRPVIDYFSEIESKRDLVRLHGTSFVYSGQPVNYSIFMKNSNAGYLDSAYKAAAKYLNTTSSLVGLRICPSLYRELYSTFCQFNKTYDMSLPKVSVVVRSILDYQSSLYHSILHSQSSGTHESAIDKFGNVSIRVSNNEYYRLKLNEKIIDAVRILDQMIEGSKNININLNTSAIPIEDVLSGLTDEVARAYSRGGVVDAAQDESAESTESTKT